MPKEISRPQLIAILREVQGQTSLNKFADEMGCSAALLCKVYKGKREPGPLLLEYLGIEKKIEVKTTYRWR